MPPVMVSGSYAERKETNAGVMGKFGMVYMVSGWRKLKLLGVLLIAPPMNFLGSHSRHPGAARGNASANYKFRQSNPTAKSAGT